MYQDPNAFDPNDDSAVSDTAIAIVGMSCRFADARGLDAYWSLLSEGREGVETYSDEELIAAGVSPAALRNRHYVRRGAPLADMECFDASLFGLSPRDAAIMDPQHRHFLECAWEALENAGHTPQRFDGTIGVFAGSGHNAYMPYNLLTNPKLVRDVGLFLLRHTSNDKDFLTTRVSYLFDLKGPSINVQTACSTSLVSIHMAAQSLISGECDMAIAGGTSIELPHRQGYVFEEGEILSPDGHCRPFDADSQGTVFGSGVAVVALRRLADAIEAGDHIYAVVRGSAINNDGAGKVGYLAPSVDGQAKVIAEALAMADVDAGSISYVEAHGTGTPVGDPIEVAALTQAFRQSTDRVGHCAIGSVKGNIGHTDTAAGAAGLIKVALSLHNRELPASLNFTAPNPGCAFEGSPFRVQAARAPWLTTNGQPRRAGISSLGVGGTNAHIVLEEAPVRRTSGRSRNRQILLTSARSDAVAGANAAALADHLDTQPTINLADAAYTLAIGRQHLPHRRFAVATTAAEAAERLRATPERAAVAAIADRPVSFLFCGAGPQHVDMARGLYDAEPAFRAEVDKALAVCDRIGVTGIKRWMFPAAADRAQAAQELERPSIALPALFIIQTSLARFWMAIGVQPSGMIGHSSGEYAAAHISGVIDLEAGLRIVSARGRLFETIRDGGMLSVPMAEAELLPLLPAGLSIATINAPRLCVVSGPAAAIARFHAELEAQEIEAQVVRIAVAAHSPMLDPILPEFRALMRTIPLKAPKIPFASNLTGDWVQARDVTDPEYWVRHLRETVRFTDGLQRLLADPECALLEVGPGRGMASLARQNPGRQKQQPVLSSLRHPDQAVDDDAFVFDTMGQLWALGVAVDWDAFFAGEQRLKLPLPTYRFDRQRHWFDAGAPALSQQHDPDAALDRHEDVAEWRYEPVWTRSATPAAAVAEGPAMVLEDRSGLSHRIVDRLRAAGRDVVMVRASDRFRRRGSDRFTVDPASTADYAQLFDCLAAEGRLPTQIYHCWLVTGSGWRPNGTTKLLQRGFHSLVAIAPELARQLGEASVELCLVTDHAQRLGEDRGMMPVKATALGAARVIPTEYPNLHVRGIDVALPAAGAVRAWDALADALIGELAQGWSGKPICYRAGERWVQEHKAIGAEPANAPAPAPRIRANGVYVITGGLGGLGLTIARHLAEKHQARVALIARTGLPPREDWADLLAGRTAEPAVEDRIRKVLALEAAGAIVDLVVADVGDVRGMRIAIRGIAQRLGPIAGAFHTAGTLDDGLIETKTRASIDAVLKPKLAGTLALDVALADRPVDFIMLFSSISAFAGLAGQADYAAANAFLDAYAQARHDDPVTQVLSVGWSQWAEVGMAAGLNGAGEGGAGLPDDLGAGTAIDHPVLQRLHALSDDELVATATLSPETHWLLDEHRIANAGALIPGTGYLELARAAHALVSPGPAVLSDVTFLSPFAVSDGAARDLRVHLRRRVGSDWRFVVLGRPAGGAGAWTEHATGLISADGVADVAGRLNLAQIAGRCGTRGTAEDSPVLRFGPRWDNVKKIALGNDEALLTLELDAAFHGEFDRVLLHPALLDFATAGAQRLIHGYDPARDFFAPFAYRRMVLHAPLPPKVVSHIRHRSNGEVAGLTAMFDVTIADPAGTVLAEISDFTMIRVRDASSLARVAEPERAVGAAGTVAPVERMEAILPEEGLRAIDLLLAGPARPHVILSPYDLDPALARLRAPRRTTRRAAANDDGQGDADLPVTATEQVIADLWSELLGVQPIGRHDNFFDLGGHSLLAVQFTNRLRKKTGRTLPLAALLDTPTVAYLARVIDPEGSAAADAAAAGEGMVIEATVIPAISHDVVTIRSGGSQTPIFFVHDGLGETLLYRGLALRLDPARPIYGVEPLRTAAGGYAHTRIQEMATNYVERIRTVQPDGPYMIAGLCAGGVIAFEMARQLQDVGQRVAFVGIIDAADVGAAKRPFYITRSRIDRIRALVGEQGLFTFLPSLARKAVNALRWEIGSRLRQARDRRTVQQIRDANTAGAETVMHQDAISFLKLYEVAHKLHRPEGLFAGGSVALFKASQGNGQIDDLPYQLVYADYALGWGRRVMDEVMVVSVPGGHSSVLQEPHVGTLARWFQDAVDSAADRAGLQIIADLDPADESMMAVAAE